LTHERGEAVVFIPAHDQVRPVGRVEPFVVPGAELAIAAHHGPPNTIDLTYGALSTHATRHEIGINGPLREYYLHNPLDTSHENDLVTEVGRPIFRSDSQTDDPRAP
jgi:effector-binding domain-containing protein